MGISSSNNHYINPNNPASSQIKGGGIQKRTIFTIFIIILAIIYAISYFVKKDNGDDMKLEQSIFVNKIDKLFPMLAQRSKQLSAIREQYMQNHTDYYDTIKNTMFVVLIENQVISGEEPSYCMLVNANQQKQYGIKQLKSHLNASDKFRKSVWYFSDKIYLQTFLKNQLLIRYDVKVKEETMDASYSFISKYTANCKKIIITRSQHQFINQNLPTDTPEHHFLFYSIPERKQQITHKLKLSLLGLNQTQVSSLILITNPQILGIISPLNFAFQNIYTFTHLVWYPLLAAMSGSDKFKQFNSIHNIQSKLTDSVQFSLQRLPTKRQHLCFVNYPSDLRNNNVTDYSEILKSFPEKQAQSFSIVTTFIYTPSISLQPYVELALKMKKKGIQIKIRFKDERVRTSLQVYEAVFSYCPDASTVVSSRHNINFLPALFNSDLIIHGLCVIPEKVNPKIPHYLVPLAYENINQPSSKQAGYQFEPQRRKFKDTEQFFTFAQIFCEQIYRVINITFLKSKETDFYQSEESFMFLIAQISRQSFSTTKTPYFKVRYYNGPSKLQLQQAQALSFRQPGRKLRKGLLQPAHSSALNNKGYKRNAPQVIPRIIHQIYLSDSRISQQRLQLTKTILKKHPNFMYKMWKMEDITRENFPMTYDVIQIFFNYGKTAEYNIKSAVTDFMRIQILYRYGGIYLDLKFEAKKSLIPYLKFEQLYLFMSYLDMNPNNQAIKTTLSGIAMSIPFTIQHKLIMQKFFDIKFFQDYFSNPGDTLLLCTTGIVLRNAYTIQELISEVAWGEDLFRLTLNPGPCHSKIAFDRDNQKVYQFNFGLTYFNKTATKRSISFPCYYDNEKYFQMYYEMASTYQIKKQAFQ